MISCRLPLSSVLLLLIICAVGVLSTEQKKLSPTFGTSPEVAEYYKGKTSFTCFSTGKKIPIEQVNDDYCDCEDGSDEPGTAACSNGHFHCVNKGYRAESISSTMVNDGVCDCCDGSDEYEKKIKCTDTCDEKGAVLRKDRQEKIDRYKDGLKKKEEMINEAKTIYADKKSELERLKKEVDPLKETIKGLEVKKEQLEKKRDEEIKRLEEERERASAAEKGEENEQDKPQSTDETGTATEEKKEEEVVEEKVIEPIHSELLDTIKKGKNTDNDDDEDELNNENNEEIEEEDDGPQPIRRRRTRPLNRNQKNLNPPPSPSTSPSSSSAVSSSSSLFSSLWEYIPESVQPYLEEILEYCSPVFKAFKKYLPNSISGGEDISDIDGLLATSRHDLREKEEQVEKIEKLLTYDLGKDNVFLPLYGKCFDAKTREYTYTLCPYDRASQGSTSLGKWEEWKDNHSQMSFQNGLQCWGGPKRSLTVNVECGSENNAYDVNEPSKCEYTMKFQTPAACDAEHLKVLLLEEDHVF